MIFISDDCISADELRELLRAERERCAKVCEERSDRYARRVGFRAEELESLKCAAAIRAMPDEETK